MMISLPMAMSMAGLLAGPCSQSSTSGSVTTCLPRSLLPPRNREHLKLLVFLLRLSGYFSTICTALRCSQTEKRNPVLSDLWQFPAHFLVCFGLQLLQHSAISQALTHRSPSLLSLSCMGLLEGQRM